MKFRDYGLQGLGIGAHVSGCFRVHGLNDFMFGAWSGCLGTMHGKHIIIYAVGIGVNT